MKLKIKFDRLDLSELTESGSTKEKSGIFDKIKSAAIKGAVKYAPFALESILKKKIEDYISDRELGIELDEIVIIKDESGKCAAGIIAGITKIDYFALLTSLKPQLTKKLNENSADSVISKAIEIIGADDVDLIYAVTSSLSDEKKARITALLISEYNKEICLQLSKAAAEKGIDAKIEKIILKI